MKKQKLKNLTGKEISVKILNPNSKERKEAEKMIGCKLEGMTNEQKTLAIACLVAFQGKY